MKRIWPKVHESKAKNNWLSSAAIAKDAKERAEKQAYDRGYYQLHKDEIKVKRAMK